MKKQIFACISVILCFLLCTCEGTKPVETITAEVVTAVTPVETTTVSVETTAVITAPMDPNKLNSDYTIENGVLLAYIGDETEIIIPDSVTEIAESAFKNAPQITSICLGKNVQIISPRAFRTLELLNMVTLVPENTHFIIDGHFLIKADYTQFFLVGTTIRTGWNELLAVQENASSLFTKKFEGIFGNAIVQFSCETNITFGTTITEIEAYDHTITFDSGYAYVCATGGSCLFSTENQIIFTYDSGWNIVDNYIFDQSGIYELHAPEIIDDTTYNIPVILLYQDRDNEIRFRCCPAKFLYFAEEKFFKYCVSWEELLEIDGVAIYKDKHMTYIPQTTRTLSNYKEKGILLFSIDFLFGSMQKFEIELSKNAAQYSAFKIQDFEALNSD